MKNKLVSIIIFSILIFTCCKKKESVQLTEEIKKNNSSRKKIAFVIKTLKNPYFIKMENGVKEGCDKFNLTLLTEGTTTETSVEQQAQIVENMINNNVDALLITPISDVSILPILKKVQDRGIPIVTIDERINPEISAKFDLKPIPFITVDNLKGAYLAAKYISDIITTPTEVAIIEGLPQTVNAQLRKVGAMKGFSENEKIKVVASQAANWEMKVAYMVTGKIMTKFPNVKVIFSSNDFMAFGAIEYLQKNNLTHVLVTGYDNVDQAKTLINNGKMLLTIDQHPEKQGFKAVEIAVDLMNGKSVEDVTYIPISIIKK